MNSKDLTATYSDRGYMLHYKGKPIGGAATFSSDPPRRRNGAMVKADREMFRQNAHNQITDILNGRCPQHMRNAIARIDGLGEHYPEPEWNLHVESDPCEIKKLLESKGVTCWGQGPIADTGYFQLVTTSKEHRDSKRLAIVATVEDVEKARKLS